MSKIIGMITYYWEDHMIGVDVHDDGTVLLPNGQTAIVPEKNYRHVKEQYIDAVKNSTPFLCAYEYNKRNQIEGVPESSAAPNAAVEEFSLRGNPDFGNYGKEQEKVIEEANEVVQARKEQRRRDSELKRSLPAIVYAIPVLLIVLLITVLVMGGVLLSKMNNLQKSIESISMAIVEVQES